MLQIFFMPILRAAHKCHNTIQIRKQISICTTHFQTRNTTQWLTENTFQYPQHISKLTTQLDIY